VSEKDVELVISVLGPLFGSGDGDLVAAIEDDEVWESVRDRIDPEAEVRFITRDTVGLGDITGGRKALDGLRAGWREWLSPWDEFRVELQDCIDAGDGTILMLVRSVGRMKGSGTEVAENTAGVYRVKGDRLVAIEHYLDQDQARRAAGL
jgi:ketosteroid isomerase-like protein